LWPHLTLRENILLPARNINPEKAEKDLEGLTHFFEMQGFIDNYPNQASIGQRQRVALARALILNPRYILLDEITSALDVEQTARILTKLSHLKERGIGVFLITHQIGFARSSADQIIFMDGGLVAERGGPEILDAPKTPRLQQFLSAVHTIY
jgi:ABC-type polar amino acid transport system ATPase subunit